MKIFNGEVPKNPCEGCHHNSGDCINCKAAILYQTILNQCVEVDLDEQRRLYSTYLWDTDDNDPKTFSQFVQSEIKKQEGKDHGM